MKIKNTYQAVVVGLTLYITAPTDALADEVWQHLEGLTSQLTEAQLESAKAEAIKSAGPKAVKHIVSGTHTTKGNRIWRFI
jgi:hypothetical protein